MSKKFVLAAAAAAAFAMPASAALVVNLTGSTVTGLDSGNDYAGALGGYGLSQQAINYTVSATNGPVTLTVYRVAAESGLTNWVEINGNSTGYNESNNVWSLGDILVSFTQGNGPLAGNINFFSTDTSGTHYALGGSQVAVFLPGPNDLTGNSYSSNELFFGFNDAGSSDHDFDDYVIRITAGAVPEPATWTMMILGLGLVGASMRRRHTTVSFA